MTVTRERAPAHLSTEELEQSDWMRGDRPWIIPFLLVCAAAGIAPWLYVAWRVFW